MSRYDEEDDIESNYSNDDDNVDDDDNDYDDESNYESEEDDGSSRTLLFLCEEGQLDKALIRVREWDEQFPHRGTTTAKPKSTRISEGDADELSTDSTAAARYNAAAAVAMSTIIKRELFRKNSSTGNYCLHEILAGGTSGKSAPELVERLVRRYRTDYHPVESQTIFRARPTVGSHGRTVLHWCAWCKTTPKILKLVLHADPESMCLRDNKSHGYRTPLDIAQRYWPEDGITRILKSSIDTYLPYRLRLCVHVCIHRYFLSSTEDNCTSKTTRTGTRKSLLTPFDKADRRSAGLTPRAWFVASVIGYAMQREMKDLAMRVLSFVGYGAKIDKRICNKRKSRKSTKKGGGGGDNGGTKGKSNNKSPKARKKRRI